MGASYQIPLFGSLTKGRQTRGNGLFFVKVKFNADLWLLELNGMVMHHIAQYQQLLVAGTNQVAGVADSMAGRLHHLNCVANSAANVVGLVVLAGLYGFNT